MSGLSLARVMAVLVKEFTQMRRDRLTYAMMLVMPVIQLLLFGYAINSDPKHLPAAVLIQDQSRLARSTLEALKTTGYFDFEHQARGPAELDRMMADGRAQFTVTIPPDFSRRVVRRDKAQILIEADAADPTATGAALAAVAGLPPDALGRDLRGVAGAAPGPGPPFEIVVHRRYNPENISAYNIVPGLLGVVLSMTLVMMTALAVTREQERGTMESLLATPVRPIEVMTGKLAPYVVVGLVQTAVILTLARVLFDVPMQGGVLALGIGVLLFIVGSLALGFLISTLARNQLQAMQLSVFYLLPSILLSGFLYPFKGMPMWGQALGTIIPVTHFLRVVRGALLKGHGVTELWPSLAALGVFVTVVSTLAMLRYRRTLD
ncbi:MAG: ABC transporter permease [Caulobacteraceae bacterium]|nr:ABC transporter permease [Caulobacteraceae bacterium]